MPADATAQNALIEQTEHQFRNSEYATGTGLVWRAAFEAVQRSATVHDLPCADLDESLKAAEILNDIHPPTCCHTTT